MAGHKSNASWFWDDEYLKRSQKRVASITILVWIIPQILVIMYQMFYSSRSTRIRRQVKITSCAVFYGLIIAHSAHLFLLEWNQRDPGSIPFKIALAIFYAGYGVVMLAYYMFMVYRLYFVFKKSIYSMDRRTVQYHLTLLCVATLFMVLSYIAYEWKRYNAFYILIALCAGCFAIGYTHLVYTFNQRLFLLVLSQRRTILSVNTPSPIALSPSGASQATEASRDLNETDDERIDSQMTEMSRGTTDGDGDGDDLESPDEPDYSKASAIVASQFDLLKSSLSNLVVGMSTKQSGKVSPHQTGHQSVNSGSVQAPSPETFNRRQRKMLQTITKHTVLGVIMICWIVGFAVTAVIAAFCPFRSSETCEVVFWWSQVAATCTVTLCVVMGFRSNERLYIRCCTFCDVRCTSLCESMANRKLNKERNMRIQAVMAAEKSPTMGPVDPESPPNINDITIKI